MAGTNTDTALTRRSSNREAPIRVFGMLTNRSAPPATVTPVLVYFTGGMGWGGPLNRGESRGLRWLSGKET
jgi:hypothetical protein